MDIQVITKLVLNNIVGVVAVLSVLALLLLLLTINLFMKVNYMKKRYRKMMTGADGSNLERMLIGHINEMKAVAEENERLKQENERIDALLQLAITRVSVVRFRAFDDMGSDLSYAVALLDSHNNGVILTSIFGREDSRSYVKPVENGTSTYALMEEEQQALDEAMRKVVTESEWQNNVLNCQEPYAIIKRKVHFFRSVVIQGE